MRLHPIAVDYREHSQASGKKTDPEWWARQLRIAGASANVSSLPVADFRWVLEPEEEGKPWSVVFVERKKMMDLLGSAEDGRLTRFIDETGGLDPPANQIRAVLVEGDQFDPRSAGGREWTAESVDNLLVSLQMAGVLVLRSPDIDASIERIVDFWKYTGKDSHTSLMRVQLPQPEGGYIDPQQRAAVRILMGLPGWGEARAKAALKEFGSVYSVLVAVLKDEPKGFQGVKGIGPGLVTKAREFLEAEV